MQGPVPRQHPVQYGIQALVPAGRPDAVPAPSRSCRRSPASSSPRPRLCFHDASWEEAAVAHLLQRPMSTISDQQQVASCRRDVQVPAPQARDRPVLQGRPGPRTWQCSHQRQPPAARTDLRRRGYRATDEEPAPCHKVNKSASKNPERGRALPHHQGARELPDIPTKGKHIANAHNLHERLVKHENLRFTDDHRGREPGYPPHITGRALFAPPLTTRRWFGHGCWLSGQR